MLGQLADAVIGLLRQYHARLRALERGLARGNDLRAGADIDVGELGLGHDFGGYRLLVLCDRLGIIDADQHGRPSTRAAMSNRVASTSPCTSSGCGRTRYQIDSPATAATTSPTMIEGARSGRCRFSIGWFFASGSSRRVAASGADSASN